MSMKISPLQFAQALYDAVSETSPKDHDKVLDNFVKILSETGNLEAYPKIAEEFHKLEQKAKGVSEAEITFAKEHNPKVLNDLNEIVQGKTEFKTKIDEGIVGGVIVKIDDTLIDASIKSQLEKLNQDLRQ